MELNIDWRLYVVLDMDLLRERDPLSVARAALSGGATVLQLRAKHMTVREQVVLGQSLLAVTQAYEVPLLINDHTDIALSIGAQGVHLGVDDLPVALARAIMPRGIIGYSPEGAADARRAEVDGASYLGVGPFAVTRTKPDAGAAIGARGIAEIAGAVHIPVVAVGGLTSANVLDAVEAGAAGVAVASAVIMAPDLDAAARALRSRLVETSQLRNGRS